MFRPGDVDTVVATGAAVGAILENARRSNPDLIVMGSPHRSWFDRVLFGSTLRRVLRRATVPVLVVPVVDGAQRWPNEQLRHRLGGQAWTILQADVPLPDPSADAVRITGRLGPAAASKPGAARAFAHGGRAGILLLDAGLLDIVWAFTTEVVAVVASAR